MTRSLRWVAVCPLACVMAACSSGGGSSSSSADRPSRTTTTAATDASTSTTAPTQTPNGQWSTYYRDAARSGLAPDGPSAAADVHERWASDRLDGDVYAQPLIVGDRVIIATENNTVYALNAGDGTTVWKRHLGEPVPGSSLPCGNVDPVGITSTPVVDVDSGRVYAVGLVQGAGTDDARHMLFALDLSNGRLVDSVRIDASGADPAVHNQRSALTLSNGKVYVPYGGRLGDCGDYHGRVVSAAVSSDGIGAIDSYLLPTRGRGGFWAPPGAAVATDGSLYLADGNSISTSTYDYGNSVVRLSPDLKLLDSFAPRDWADLNGADVDLGTTSPVLLPGGRVLQVGKSGVGDLLDAAHLGGVDGQLRARRVCSSAWGGVAHDGDTAFVPCSNAVVQVTVSGDDFSVGWSTNVSVPGPTIVTNGAVWTVATGNGDLVALDAASGKQLFSRHVGDVPSRFTSPAAAGGIVVVAADRTAHAFGA